jgi:hypothetical protein
VDEGATLPEKRVLDGFVFHIQTAERTFYLVAETREDMNEWVHSICQICGFTQDMGSTGRQTPRGLRWREQLWPSLHPQQSCQSIKGRWSW